MGPQELLSDLATAERNNDVELKYNRLRYSNEVSNVFAVNEVATYYDLIKKNLRQALELRRTAIRERLL
jgi:hypothetical protein